MLPVEQFGTESQVDQLGDAVGEEEDCDGIGCQIVDVIAFHHQVSKHGTEK